VLSRNLVTCREDFFCEEARKPRTIGKNSWFPGFLMELFLVAAWPRCALALKSVEGAQLLPGLNPFHRPAGVLGNQWPGITGGLLQGGQGGFVTDVAQRHTHVAQQAATFRPQNG
jgi:hypothetical protein